MGALVNSASDLFPQIPSYPIVEQLYSGSRTAVYRGVQAIDQEPVVIKVLHCEYPSFSELVQFRNQYTITKNLRIPGTICPHRLETYGNSYALIMEDVGGVSLNNYIKSNSLSLVESLAIALQLADILHHLYKHRVVHKDIKPANILIHPQSKQVKLIDFSIASLLPKETQEIQSPNVLEGTLAYLAPEQTGRMNRGIDYRADFYALGVTLYELLTGALPFEADDPLELVHCHMAKLPVPVHQINPEVPSIVAAIVAKLMAKNAEERYQSALGLKHDLEQCLIQYKETGVITNFLLAARDLSDRFLIPEKLYGRETEVQRLLESFERVAGGRSELMLVAGFSGIGKTAVVNEVHKPITRQQGYFIKGKFDQFNRNIPLSAFVQALRDLINQLLSESDTQLAQWRTQILTAVGENGQVLIEVIPELEQIIGKQPIAPELSGSAAQNRFNLLFQKFIEVFTQPEHPLVIFLDDLQWADSASLQLIKLLMQDQGHLLLLGAYRDNEVSPMHPFALTIAELKKASAMVNTITLVALAFDDMNSLIADTLNCTTERSHPLTELLIQKTQGNPFFTTQFLKVLHAEQYITFNQEQRYWECDIAQVRSLSLTDDVVEFMAMQLQKLPAETQQMLKLAACVGNQFDLTTLAIVSEQSPTDTATALWQALQEGLILPTSQVYKFFQEAEQTCSSEINPAYRFLHDRIQQAAYSLIPEEQKQTTHLAMGQILLKRTPNLDEKIFAIVSQFNLGIERVTSQTERDAIAQLNLNAARKARLSAAYNAANQYCEMALRLVSDIWQQQPTLALELYVEAANSACLAGAFEQVDRYVESVQQHTTNPLDQIQAVDVQIQALIARSQLAEAIQVGRRILEQFGVVLPEQPTAEMMAPALEVIQQRLKTVEDIANLSAMKDLQKLAAMSILTTLASAAYIGAPALYPLIVLKQIELSLEFGNAIETPYAYATYGLILCAFGGDITGGNRAADAAIALMEKFQATRFKAKIHNLVYSFSRIWQAPLQSTLEPLREGYQAGLEAGDLEFAAYCAYNHCKLAYASGQDLSQLQTEMHRYGEAIAQLKQTTALNFHQIGQQAVLNWLGETENPQDLIGTAYEETSRLPQHEAAGDVYSMGTYYVHKLILSYHFDSPQAAWAIAQAGQTAIDGIIGTAFYSIFWMYHALTLLANYSSSVDDTITEDLNRLMNWAVHAPMNFNHRCDLIRAEQQRVLGNRADAIDLYDRAIAGAKTNSYLQEEALANELAAKFYLNLGKEKVAAGYMQEAYYCYAHWGAKAKTDDLEQRYPHLLRPILQSAVQPRTVLETLATIAAPYRSTQASNNPSCSASTVNATLDFAAILKASQSLSSTIQLEELLQQLTQIILQNSGADRCVLMLPDAEQVWQVKAIATPAHTELCTQWIEGNPDVPVKLIQYVKHTQATVVVDDLKTDLPVIGEYLQQEQPKSVLCLPLLNQGLLIGILYLKNQNTSGVFTSDRILILNFLCTQAAISLENARLYQQAQFYGQQLQQSQLQIVQSEKMASLGNLVAGVAHEINNPIGFLNGSINNAKEFVQDLLRHLALYHQHHPQAAAPVQDHAEEIDLEFLRDDLPKLLNSMKGATDRIKGISTSLRTFSRADMEHKVSSNVHEGIDSTLLILKYRIKANEFRPAIEVIQEYGELPEIYCFPGQLNQVFMNILANAIDMFDEMAQSLPLEELKAHPQKITICTAIANNRVQLSIQDNGKGMSDEVKAKIFDHLFTTKGVGKGTGLGLAIARQIVVEKHGGSLEVYSQAGKGTEFCIQLPL
jgi:predicted ATPase/signal transduction histidine kinase